MRTFFSLPLAIVLDVRIAVVIAVVIVTISTIVVNKKADVKYLPLTAIKNAEVSSTNIKNEYGEAYRNLAMHVFLCVITLGIWFFIWVYKTTKFLNKTPNSEQYDPADKLLLCMFIPMYQTYWFYKHGAKVDVFCQHKGIQNSYLMIICALIPIPIVSSVIMQDKINQICTSK